MELKDIFHQRENQPVTEEPIPPVKTEPSGELHAVLKHLTAQKEVDIFTGLTREKPKKPQRDWNVPTLIDTGSNKK